MPYYIDILVVFFFLTLNTALLFLFPILTGRRPFTCFYISKLTGFLQCFVGFPTLIVSKKSVAASHEQCFVKTKPDSIQHNKNLS